MILELDLGNTRAKWRVLNKSLDSVAQGVAGVSDWLDGRFPECWQGVERVRAASVLAPLTESRLAVRLLSQLSVRIEIAKSSRSCCGVTNAYADPERLGVDRWLALVAAYKKCGEAVMVIDVGTALKVDACDDAGRHLGGYIIPGFALMERALFEGTDRVRYEGDQTVDSMELGRDTRTCVQGGITAALVGAVMVASERSRLAVGRLPRLYITGGVGLHLVERLCEVGIRNVCFESDLVLDGLRWSLP